MHTLTKKVDYKGYDPVLIEELRQMMDTASNIEEHYKRYLANQEFVKKVMESK